MVPDEWRKGIIVELPKKGNLTDCNNWTGIRLLSIQEYILFTILLKRLRSAVVTLREEQTSFRETLLYSFTLRNIIDQCLEF